ncbi:hypothetical protein [Actinomadura keratinilytica]|uniref:Replication protein n=1 Tax=Actinomadura keratinilytica TaxID=547461 RepID=A0ABP7ZEN4_9ACTN
MKIRRARPSVEWTQIPNVVARDYRLSWRARGLLLELLSYPPGWETTIDELVKRAQRQAAEVGGRVEGRDAMRAAARELKRAGYLVVTKSQDQRGRWRTDVEVTDAPMWDLLSGTDDGFSVVGATSTEHDVSAGRTDDGFPAVGSPAVGSPGVSKKKERKKETPPPSAHRDAEVTGASGVPAQNEQEEEDPSQNEGGADALELVDAAAATWEGHRSPTPTERATLAQRVAEALRQGAAPDAIQYVLSHDLGPGQARSAVAVVMSRTAQPGWWAATVPLKVAQKTSVPMPPWCGRCESPHYRWVYDSEGRPGRCPNCNPHADPVTKPAGQDAEAAAALGGVVSGLEEFRRRKEALKRA